jgi:imidazolonepropionase-like amidohydrolase
MSSTNRVAFHGSKVLLPNHNALVQASVVADINSRTVLSIIEGPSSEVGDDVTVIDAGDNIILPGLVE